MAPGDPGRGQPPAADASERDLHHRGDQHPAQKLLPMRDPAVPDPARPTLAMDPARGAACATDPARLGLSQGGGADATDDSLISIENSKEPSLPPLPPLAPALALPDPAPAKPFPTDSAWNTDDPSPGDASGHRGDGAHTGGATQGRVDDRHSPGDFLESTAQRRAPESAPAERRSAADLANRSSTPRMSAFKRRGSQGSHFSKEVQMPANPPIINIHALLASDAAGARTENNPQAGTKPSPGGVRLANVEDLDPLNAKHLDGIGAPTASPNASRVLELTSSRERRKSGDPSEQLPISPTYGTAVSAPQGKLKNRFTKVVQKTKIPGPVSRRRKRIKDGQVVFKGHKSWEIVLSIQFGLHYTSDLLRDCDEAEPTAADFRESLAFDFNPIDEQRSSVFDVNKYAKWVHPAPFVYRRIRAKFGVNEVQFLAATCSESRVRELPTPGKSGALFYITDDENYFMKTISWEEEKLLLAMLPSYYEHVSNNPDTFLTRYLAHFSVETTRNRHIRMVVMASVFNDSIYIDKKFDLKGSTYKRFAKPEELRSENVTLKDLDLDSPIFFNPEVLEDLLSQLAKDTAFLEMHHVMDYSLLLGLSEMLPEEDQAYKDCYGEHEESGPYYIGYQRNAEGVLIGHRICMGIIDFLQRFRTRKKMEYGARVMQTCSTITASVCPPSVYRRRFLDFLKRKLIADPAIVEPGPGNKDALGLIFEDKFSPMPQDASPPLVTNLAGHVPPDA